MKLKHISLLMLVFALAIVACSSTQNATTSATETTTTSYAGSFTSLRVMGPLPVTLVQQPSKAGTVQITASERARQLVKSVCTDGTLNLEFKVSPAESRYADEIKKIVVYCGDEVHQLVLTGSGVINAENIATHTDLTAVLTGSGVISLEKADCPNFTASVTGSGMINLKKVLARNVSTSVTGSGVLSIKTDATAFNCTVSGSGMANVGGTAVRGALALRGSGMINGSDLQCGSLSLSLGGSGMINYDAKCSQVKVISGHITSPGILMR